MTEEKIAMLLEKLGTDGLHAFYAYLVVDYGSLWLLLALCAWGIRAVWSKVKESL